MGKGSKNQTVTNTSPFAKLQLPFLETGYEEALNYLNAPGNMQYFPGRSVVPFSRQTQGALSGMEAFARQPPQLLNAASRNAMQTLRGDFMDAGIGGRNPYARAMFRQTAGQLLPQVSSAFAGAGRGGSGLANEAVGRALAQAQEATYGRLYESAADRQLQAAQAERGRQFGTMQFAPSLYESQFMPQQMLARVGAAREGKRGEQIADEMRRFDFSRDQGLNVLMQYLNLIGSPTGGVGTTTTSGGNARNLVAGGLGGAATGAGLAGLLGFTPAWPFALGGGLLGLF